MSLFKRKEKEEPAQEFTFTLTSTFRGYKKFPIVVHGDQVIEKNNAEIGMIPLKGKQIVFRSAKTKDNRPFLQVFLDGIRVGSVFDEAKVAEMLSGKVEAAYAMMEEETVAGKGKSEVRTRIRVFVKYAEG